MGDSRRRRSRRQWRGLASAASAQRISDLEEPKSQCDSATGQGGDRHHPYAPRRSRTQARAQAPMHAEPATVATVQEPQRDCARLKTTLTGQRVMSFRANQRHLPARTDGPASQQCQPRSAISDQGPMCGPLLLSPAGRPLLQHFRKLLDPIGLEQDVVRPDTKERIHVRWVRACCQGDDGRSQPSQFPLDPSDLYRRL